MQNEEDAPSKGTQNSKPPNNTRAAKLAAGVLFIAAVGGFFLEAFQVIDINNDYCDSVIRLVDKTGVPVVGVILDIEGEEPVIPDGRGRISISIEDNPLFVDVLDSTNSRLICRILVEQNQYIQTWIVNVEENIPSSPACFEWSEEVILD